ncbi:MAG: MGMT family protein [Candidatus Zapsychrus exili]|nr:MGMT family protein [Candidatus Zapsychrus exili]
MKPRKQLTEFQRQVLKATLDISIGETRTYKWIAKRVGNPKSMRAVGQALAQNPYPIRAYLAIE